MSIDMLRYTRQDWLYAFPLPRLLAGLLVGALIVAGFIYLIDAASL